jgi:hypothetical protein
VSTNILNNKASFTFWYRLQPPYCSHLCCPQLPLQSRGRGGWRQISEYFDGFRSTSLIIRASPQGYETFVAWEYMWQWGSITSIGNQPATRQAEVHARRSLKFITISHTYTDFMTKNTFFTCKQLLTVFWQLPPFLLTYVWSWIYVAGPNSGLPQYISDQGRSPKDRC